jgi:hypothetical protein
MSTLPHGYEPRTHAPSGTTMEQLLAPAEPSNDGFVHLQGGVRVEAAIWDDFRRAETYLGRSQEAVDQLYHLTHSADLAHPDRGVDIRATSLGHNAFGAGPDNRPTISWAPHGASRNTDGSAQSPAMALLHETGHATEWQSNTERYARNNADYPDPHSAEYLTWTRPEEQRNITGLENRVGRELGEGIRHDHQGSAFLTRDATSREPEPARARIAHRVAELAAAGHSGMPPVGPGTSAVVPYDGHQHSGAFADIGNGEAAQSLGRGHYMVYDVARDLGGVMPREATPLAPAHHGGPAR